MKIAVLEHNPLVADMLSEMLETESSWKNSGVAASGKEGLDIIKNRRPNVVLLDLDLPDSEGFAVLETLRAEEWRGTVLAFTGQSGSGAEERALYCGACLIKKPFRLEILKEKLKYIEGIVSEGALSADRAKTAEERLSDIFIQIGIPVNYNGFIYAQECIKKAALFPKSNKRMMKALYTEVGKEYKTNEASVERAIRNALDKALKSGNFGNIDRIFHMKIYEGRKTITNSQFILLLSDRLRLGRL